MLIIAPRDVAAVKRGGPFDRTNHSQQENCNHAQRSWSHARVKGQRGDTQQDITMFVFPVFVTLILCFVFRLWEAE